MIEITINFYKSLNKIDYEIKIQKVGKYVIR